MLALKPYWENPLYGILEGAMETSASFEARSAPLPYSTTGEQRSRDEPSGSKAMGLYLEAACKRKLWEQIPGKHSSARPSIINVIEAVRLCAFAPPSSSLDRHRIVVFPRSMNNPG
jgi:hypothetical protein